MIGHLMDATNGLLSRFLSLRWYVGLIVLCTCVRPVLAQTPPEYWQHMINQGRNQHVYFHAWGADPNINQYIQWLAKQVKQQYNIQLHHVKLSNTSDAVSRVLAEKSAGNHRQGQVDLIWINGENFAAMAKHQLLTPGWVTQLPNFALTNPLHNPAMTLDFGIPTQGMEAPWGKASLAFYYNSDMVAEPPTSLSRLLNWSRLHPGRFSYPKPPDFLAMSFLKYALIVLTQSQPAAIQDLLYQPVTEVSQALLLPRLWQYLEQLHPHLWRQGRHFVASGTALRRLMGDNELALAYTFSIAQIPAAVERFDLTPAIRSYLMADGSLSNIHFVAIPYNAANTQAAKLVADYMLSPAAQAYKQRPDIWGDRSVLDLNVLTQLQQAMFTGQAQHPSALPDDAMAQALSEPHPSWTTVIAKEWLQRYGVRQ